MIKFGHEEVFGWEAAIRGMRNPMNSWNKSDSEWTIARFAIGQNDEKLMMQLCNAGTDHRKFMRMIVVYVDITAPLYWWKEFDTYKVGTVANSCSTMHKIAEKEFTEGDFSVEYLMSGNDDPPVSSYLHCNPSDDEADPYALFCGVLELLNNARRMYISTHDKKYWWQMIQLLPSSYNQRRTIMMNYEVLANIYKSRKGHKLDEWNGFCTWIESLPCSELITGKEDAE